MSGAPDPRPLYLALGREPVFGVLHPAAGAATGTAVVLCGPFGWEGMTTHRSLVAWAGHLAGEGTAALRIDLPGTGDSGGRPGDDDLLGAWTTTVAGAAGWLRAETGCRRLAVVAIGLGGLLAARATAAGAPIDDLVLWGVPERGRELVRRLRAFARLESSRLEAQGVAAAPPLPPGALAPAGYLVTAATREAIEAVDLTEPWEHAPARALLLAADDGAAGAALAAALATAGADVRTEPGHGYGAMVAGDLEVVRPATRTFARVSAWLASPAPESVHAIPAAPAAPFSATAELSWDGATVRESPLTIPGPAGPLSAILSEPADGHDGRCLVLLNAGPQRRIGPNRMWVELARRWAPRGVPALRLDLPGIGDSAGASRGWDDEPLLYEPATLDAVRAALDALQARGIGGPFTLIGLCSGAYWAFRGLQAEPRVTGAVLINPRTLAYDRTASRATPHVGAGRLATGATWRRLAGGEISMRGIRRFLRASARRVLLSPVHAWVLLRDRVRARRHGDPLAVALAAAERDGKRALVVFSDREPLRARLEADGGMALLRDAPHVQLELVASGAETHTLQPPWMQARVHAILDDALAADLGRRAGVPAP